MKSLTTIALDLKPENLLFKSREEEADVMIADFGLSRIMDDDKLTLLTEICGTPGVSGYHSYIAGTHARTTVHGTRDLQEE
jgi:hypothetical protein